MRYLCMTFLLALLIVPSAIAAPAQLVCAMGQTTWLSGTGVPHTPLLVYWAGRPVGGGSVNTAGHWAIPLMVGRERPGMYAVDVRSRENRALIGAFTCAVGVALAPSAAPITPTPTPITPNFDRNGDGQVTCADFDTQTDAEIALAAGYTNLDNDSDGIPCEGLPK